MSSTVRNSRSSKKKGKMPKTYGRLAPEVNRILYVRNLPFKISGDDMYEIFGKFGTIRQIRLGSERKTRGSAFVVYEDVYDAKNALESLSGFNVGGRYLVVLYYKVKKGLNQPDGGENP